MNKLTPGSNMMWEGSRMMLPELVYKINQGDQEKLRKTRPEFDEQYLSEIAELIQKAWCAGYPVIVRLFGEFEDKETSGWIAGVDYQKRKLKVKADNWMIRIPLDDILSIEKAP